ncbi:E3 ubiquitin-protein ligase SINA-like 2 [Raphanus sativus]|nr:E3 ubiquitin-protein ligase SINA-like 2 [Raphanus sativus]
MKKCFPALDDLRIYKWQNRKKLWFNFTVDLYIAMMKETNREKGVAGEASSSSSRRKRQRLASVAEDEGRGVTASVDEDEVIPPEARSGTLLDLDLLDCPVCLEALTKHVFQCDNGHIACSSCCLKLRNKCPACALPIGNNRCRIVERIVESVTVPCPNAKHGCTEKFSYGKESAHEEECGFSLCYCPAPDCNFAGVYKDLYSHYDADHKDTTRRFVCGTPHHTYLAPGPGPKISVLQEYRVGPLVVVQCFEGAQGMSLTVNCIAPSAPGVGKFSFDLTHSLGRQTVTFGSTEMNRIQRVNLETPEEDFMSIPSYLVSPIMVNSSEEG